MNTLSADMMVLLIDCVRDAMTAMRSIQPIDRPDGFSGAIGRLTFAHNQLLRTAVSPVAVEPTPPREPEAV